MLLRDASQANCGTQRCRGTSGLSVARALTFVVLAGLCGLATGCGGDALDTVDVDGNVTIDGKPLENGIVRFVPVDEEGLLATGTIQKDGTFKLATKGTNGTLRGEYKVSVVSQKIDESVPERDRELGIGGKVSAIPKKYNDPKTSGLTETIDSTRSIEITLSAD